MSQVGSQAKLCLFYVFAGVGIAYQETQVFSS